MQFHLLSVEKSKEKKYYEEGILYAEILLDPRTEEGMRTKRHLYFLNHDFYKNFYIHLLPSSSTFRRKRNNCRIPSTLSLLHRPYTCWNKGKRSKTTYLGAPCEEKKQNGKNLGNDTGNKKTTYLPRKGISGREIS